MFNLTKKRDWWKMIKLRGGKKGQKGGKDL